ncbi:hypothetical protein [Kibdelosporangium phytohabitans]|uniref:Lipoprotein n=1 Tax=Kibdelosporangium phytohabitans TaxID=860235 RepID=A0A0N9HZM4_9PSEU|nr:hypothetical protein [Kibdelosporangium phytohabitans]ALG08845.1 hypothetical protein AOZ06_19735 [Kibdelosporangium phytohabitans]MBE1470007.1 putative lipoprotein with Yx(FWY)xxD motif [Kibdelosporangium phytohabitans]
MARKHSAVLVALLAVGVTACTHQEPPQDTSALAVEKNIPAKAEPTPLLLSGTARMYNVAPDSEGWAQLGVGKSGALDPVLVDAAGLTLYRFDDDSSNPPRSHCDGDCATAWRPVTVAANGRIFLDGVRKASVGVVRRSDGALQVTVGGWPVYRHAADTRPGDTTGHGVGRRWFGLSPSGERASSTILFDGTAFDDSEPTQAVTGRGCVNLPRPGVTSSVTSSGWITLWSGRDCTGKSVTVRGKVADLASARFDDTVVSVSS